MIEYVVRENHDGGTLRREEFSPDGDQCIDCLVDDILDGQYGDIVQILKVDTEALTVEDVTDDVAEMAYARIDASARIYYDDDSRFAGTDGGYFPPLVIAYADAKCGEDLTVGEHPEWGPDRRD